MVVAKAKDERQKKSDIDILSTSIYDLFQAMSASINLDVISSSEVEGMALLRDPRGTQGGTQGVLC